MAGASLIFTERQDVLTYRTFRPDDRDIVIDLIKESVSTDRTPRTWDGNPLTATLAFDKDTLVGAVPFEKRILNVGAGNTVKVLWVTAAHVKAEYRSMGIGTDLLNCANKHFADEFEAFGVYREDETSAAFRYYANAGFTRLLPILAFRKQVDAGVKANSDAQIITSADGIQQIEAQLRSTHAACTNGIGGFPARHKGFWKRVFDAHYYRELVDYTLLIIPDGDAVQAFALLGRTDMRDGIDRFDILEFVAKDKEDADRLQSAVEGHATSLGVNEVRQQMAANEARRNWAERNGYIYAGRRTNILGCLFNRRAFLERRWRESALEGGFTIECPGEGVITLGTTCADNASCFIDDDALDVLAFQRVSAQTLVSEGRVICLNAPEQCVTKLETLFPHRDWNYFQVDYI